MTKEEMLTYLSEKRKLTAPVASAQSDLTEARAAAAKHKKAMYWGIGLFVLVFGVNVNPALSLVFLVFAGYKFYRLTQAKQVVEQAEAIYSNEINHPDYIAGKNGFPEKFYNYRDTYRLWKLISEGRALTLQEAYNLLETQQFQENQLSIQEEMKAMQADIASSSRVSAVANIATAYNSFKR